MGKTVKLYINGVEKHFEKLHYVKNHPNPDPDSFDVTMDAEEASGITSFNRVEIKKDGITEFYGFVEEISPDEDAENGEDVVITGRCWKLILWKKFNERYQESREVGPINIDGSVETGFFGSVSPKELIKLILRCPISEHPKGKIRHKIGWGIASDNWSCVANVSSEARYPDWVGLRRTGLSWRGRGTVDTFNTDTLVVDGFDATYSEWNTDGASPWLDTDDDETSRIWLNVVGGHNAKVMGDFSFQDLDVTRIGVYAAKLHVKYSSIRPTDVYIYDGTDWTNLGQLGSTSGGYFNTFATNEFDVTSILNTVAKVNAAKIRFWNYTGMGYSMVTYAYLTCITETNATTDQQRQDDYFIIDLGAYYDDVTAIMLECRNNPLCYPQNYKIQYTSVSNCSDETTPPLESEWQDFSDSGAAINVAGNTFRDIIHSWDPVNNVRGIRIKLTADADYPWEISQAFVWQGDEDKYRLISAV